MAATVEAIHGKYAHLGPMTEEFIQEKHRNYIPNPETDDIPDRLPTEEQRWLKERTRMYLPSTAAWMEASLKGFLEAWHERNG